MVQMSKPNFLELEKDEVISDYRIAYKSRQASIIGRREVLSGKAKFGIFGDGKELPQLAMAKVFQPGDIRSGYYRDQTFMFAAGMHSIAEYFAQLYADTDLDREPASGGRSMNGHFSTRTLNDDGTWKNLVDIKISSADVSPTASQMPRLVGLSYASVLYRNLEVLRELKDFSRNGNEIAFGTIGNASAAEGIFWESLNAISVLQAPAIISIWDDDYGISVPNQFQFGKKLSDLLEGFRKIDGDEYGYQIYKVRGWDYPALIQTYSLAENEARANHSPAIIYVHELTQPQGHSTSGSHERYKTKERLAWERDYDCLVQFRQWILKNNFATEEEINELEATDRLEVERIREKAWKDYKAPIYQELKELLALVENVSLNTKQYPKIDSSFRSLTSNQNPLRKDLLETIGVILRTTSSIYFEGKNKIIDFKKKIEAEALNRYGSHLNSQSTESALQIPEAEARYSKKSPLLNGFEILNQAFDSMLARDPRVIAFGEDLGKIGGVNQGFAGLQEKYGENRVTDTGIRESTIIGQAIGMAMRGLRPIAEIQYLDYLLYALQIISDDLATVQWRTVGGQKSPVIIRTRGHRLEGIWHSGSPMAGIINLVRGVYVIVPRNMVQAAGFYNTLLLSDDPGIVVEVLNGYRLKERLPDNIGEYTIPLGKPEVIRQGTDVTIVTYGPLCKISEEAAELLADSRISVEIIDVRTLLPFDLESIILSSLRKTNRVLFLDEDMPGGTSAYMMQQVLEKQGGYYWLDSEPRTLSAQPHRPAFGSDGNYFSKPNIESVFETVYEIMHEADPQRYPNIFD